MNGRVFVVVSGFSAVVLLLLFGVFAVRRAKQRAGERVPPFLPNSSGFSQRFTHEVPEVELALRRLHPMVAGMHLLVVVLGANLPFTVNLMLEGLSGEVRTSLWPALVPGGVLMLIYYAGMAPLRASSRAYRERGAPAPSAELLDALSIDGRKAVVSLMVGCGAALLAVIPAGVVGVLVVLHRAPPHIPTGTDIVALLCPVLILGLTGLPLGLYGRTLWNAGTLRPVLVEDPPKRPVES